MAGGLDELIEFLLGEIALGGERGIDLPELVSLVRQFYTASQHTEANQDGLDESNLFAKHTTCTVDRPFIAQIWTWLGRHADVALGRAHEYDRKTLDDVEKEYPGYTILQSDNHNGSARGSAPTVYDQTLANSADPPTESNDTGAISGPHIYVSEDRMWIAICGHPPDPAKVFAMEWKLMLHIAAAGRKGILQGQLVQASGQDKRSVPKRTDALHEKGYIEKKSIYLRGNKTSQLFLRRFGDVAQSNGRSNSTNPAVGQTTVRHLVRQIFEVLKYNPLIPQEDLASALGMASPERIHALSLLIKHFGRNGCLKRVKTAFGPAAQTRDLETCISYLKDPTDQETQSFDVFDVDQPVEAFVSKHETVAGFSGNPELPRGSDGTEQIRLLQADDDCIANLRTVLPKWNPDRILANVLFEAALNAGSAGFKNTDARSLITGPFIKRTLESLLAKISHRALQAQPADLRHLALLRTQEFSNGVLQFVHYPFEIFVEKVLNGTAGWTDISGGDSFLGELRRLGKSENDIATRPETDAFGFVIRAKPVLQEHGGKATMTRLLAAVKAKDNEPRAGEPSLIEIAPGSFEISHQGASTTAYFHRQRGTGKAKGSKPQAAAKATKKVSQRSDNEEKPVVHGRPRKFAQGTEKYWRDIFTTIVQQADPQHLKKFGKNGLMSDGRALKIYHERPPAFDRTLLQAMALGLPLASDPQSISQRWVDQTDAIINRSEPGLYVTPVGYHPSHKKKKAQTLIFRSSRLKELNLSDRKGPWPWQKFTSSASHSFIHRPYFPQFRRTPHHVTTSPLKGQAAQRLDDQREQHDEASQREIFLEEFPNSGNGVRDQTAPNRSDEAEDVSVGVRELTHTTSDNTDLVSQVSDPICESAHTEEGVERINDTVPTPSPEMGDLSVEHNVRASTAPTPTRSGRRRRPTRKAAERADTQDSGTDNIEASLATTSADKGPDSPQTVTSQFQFSSARIGETPFDDSISSLHVQDNTQAADTIHAISSVPAGDVTEPRNQSLHEINRSASDQPVAAEKSMQLPFTIPDLETVVDEACRIVRTHEKRSYASFRESTEDANDDTGVVTQNHTSPSPKRRKEDGEINISRSQVAKLCRILTLELLGLCSGLVPNNPSTLKRAMWPKWQEAGIKSEQLSVKTLRAGIKALCSNGKCKQITFAFRGRTGTMIKMSILALQSMHTTSTVVLDLQKKMIEAEPGDFSPPELEAEALRAPMEANRRRYAKELQLYEFAVSQEDALKTSKQRKGSRKANLEDAPSPHPESDHVSPPGSTATAHNSFITLRVPRLKELNIPQEYQFRYQPPPPTLLFNVSRSTGITERANPVLKVARQIGLRRKRGTRFDPETHKLIWKKPLKSRFPTCLDDIPDITTSRKKAARNVGDSYAASLFEVEVDCVAAWEEKLAGTAGDISAQPLAFINHSIPAESLYTIDTIASVEFRALVEFNDVSGEGIEIEFPAAESWAPFVTALEDAKQALTTPAPTSRGRRPRKPAKRKANSDDLYVEGEDREGPAVKKRKQNPREPKLRRSRRTKMFDDEDILATVPLKRNRITQLLRYLSEEEKYHIVVAVVTVRTLAGGIEKFIDWRLVCRLLPAQEEQYLKEAWKTMLNKYRSDIVDLTESLQHSYIEALVEGRVPTVNFDTVHATDWEGIHRWALTSLTKSIIKKIEDLPATRRELLRRNDYVFEEHKGLREVLGYNYNLTVPRKEECVSGVVFGKALQVDPQELTGPRHKVLAEQEEEDVELLRAKSWIVATLLTPESSFDPEKIQQKLLMLAPTPQESETLLEKALKCLQRDKLASRMKGLGPGFHSSRSGEEPRFNRIRSFELSLKFFEQFEYRRMVTPAMLRRAANYKLNVLDPIFSRGDSLVLAKDAALDDGEVVAILNLFAAGMLRITPGDDVPANLWGLEWEKHGYTTRMFDKKVLSFSVALTPAHPGYVAGDPVAAGRRATAVPRGEIDRADGRGRIPAWFDVTHAFLPRMWETVLGATLGLVSTRPGIGAREIARTFWHAVDAAQVDMVLAWAEEMGLVKKTGSGLGWDTCVWWWMGVGLGVGAGETGNGGWKVDSEIQVILPGEEV